MNLRFFIVPTLSGLTLVALALVVVLAGLLALPAGRRLLERTLGRDAPRILALAWLVTVVATGGSLYLSEGLGLEPCALCWYQRIAMYPLVIVLGVAALRRDDGIWMTALPLCGIGALVSAYHVAVQHMPGIEITSCSASAPCSVKYLVAYGFVTIPVMAGSAFLLTGALVLLHGMLSRRPG